jgi:hypothetical protein
MKTHIPLLTALALSGAVLLGAGPTSQSLPLTVAFINAGGGAGSFSTVRAFTNLIGSDALQAELRNLRSQYNSDDDQRFVRAMDFTISDAWQRAGQDDVKMPSPSTDSGKALVRDMINAGTAPGGAFRMNAMLDALLTPKVHGQVMNDLNARYGPDASPNLERVGTQFFSDLAQAL